MRNPNIAEVLKQFDIFSCLTEKNLKEVSELTYWRTYKKGQILFMEGDPRERIYFLVQGFVKLEKINASGTMLYYDYVKQNNLFPYGGLFTDTTYHYSAEAVTDVELYYMPTVMFENMVRGNRNQLMLVVSQLSKILELHEGRVQKITTPSAQDRVIQSIHYLMNDLGEREGSDIVIHCPITTTEISKISATSRETVSGVLKQLRNDDVISCSGKKMTIHNMHYFQEASF
ncbi:Crp/Fnr family transcriptional regulator [Microbacteriaceae bacterium 4G12]